jgi:hypothetical protein
MNEWQLRVYQKKRVGLNVDCVAWSRVALDNMYTWVIMLYFDTRYVSQKMTLCETTPVYEH